MTTTDGEFEFSPYERYSRQQINSVGLVPTENIDEVSYEEPYPTGDAQPCSDCRGQGYTVAERNPYARDSEEYYRVSKCSMCGGSGEIKFLCEHCGTKREFTTSKGMRVRHASGCPEQEFCLEQTGDGQTCGRPVVATFDIRADGKRHGFCGIHSKNKAHLEASAANLKEHRAESMWRSDVYEKTVQTEDQVLAEIAKQFGLEELKAISHFGQPKEVMVPLEALKKFFGLVDPEVVDPLAALPIEITDDPAPF